MLVPAVLFVLALALELAPSRALKLDQSDAHRRAGPGKIVLRVALRQSARRGGRRGAFLQTGASSTQQGGGNGGRGPPADALFGRIFVGLPPQEFLVAFDTGSGNVVLPSKACTSLSCLSHRKYDSANSATAKPILRANNLTAVPKDSGRETVELLVGKGSVSGVLTSDRVCLGPEENLCAQTGIVEALRMSDASFALLPYDGILGLSMPGVSIRKHFNMMGNLAASQALALDRFAVWISAEQDGEDSEITFGAADEARLFSPEILWERLSRPEMGMWELALKDVSVDGTDLHACGKTGCHAAFDTGTSVIGGPSEVIENILARLDVATDCSNFDALPLLGFTFGRRTFQLEPADYVTRTGTGCFPRLLAVDVPPPLGPLVLLGAPFLRRYVTVYDRPTLQLGLALAKHKASADSGDESMESANARLILTEEPAEKGEWPSLAQLR